MLGSANLGPITAFLHYSLGAGGGPAATYLFFLSDYNEHTQSLYRGGLYELPLAQSPGERLDDLTQYGYYGAHVGLNNLPLSSPRWGLQGERTFGKLHVFATASLGAFQGAPYGGKPVNTGETTWMKSPEAQRLAALYASAEHQGRAQRRRDARWAERSEFCRRDAFRSRTSTSATACWRTEVMVPSICKPNSGTVSTTTPTDF